jgi:chromosome segregation ATPase
LEETNNTRTLREQIQEMCAKLEKLNGDNEAMNELFIKYGLHQQDGTPYNELQAKYIDAKNKIEGMETIALNLEAVNQQLNDDLQNQLKNRPRSQAGTPQGQAGSQQANVKALQDEVAALQASQATLRETNQKLRAEIDPIKEKLEATETERTDLKDRLRAVDLTKHQDEEEYAKKLKELNHLAKIEKKLENTQKKLQDTKKKLDECEKSKGPEVDFERADQEKAELEATIQDLLRGIEVNKQICERDQQALEAKIAALEDAKADRQRQIERQAKKIAELENKDPGKISSHKLDCTLTW